MPEKEKGAVAHNGLQRLCWWHFVHPRADCCQL